MKKILLFVPLVAITAVFFACSQAKTAQELMKEEKKAIERFIVKNEIEETGDTTKMYNDKTGKVYFKTKEGLYIHVISKGDGPEAIYSGDNRTIAMVRFRDRISFKTDTTKYTNVYDSNPITFRCGDSYTYRYEACEGWDIGLSYVRENGEVSLIIPSKLRSYDYQSTYEPLYYGYIIYRFQ